MGTTAIKVSACFAWTATLFVRKQSSTRLYESSYGNQKRVTANETLLHLRVEDLRQSIIAKVGSHDQICSPRDSNATTFIALEQFLQRPREKDADIIARENVFLVREMQIRDTSKSQLRKYMIATDEDEPVDPKEWGRYKYGAPRDVPRNDVDQITEQNAQRKLFVKVRSRTVSRRIETRRTILEAERREKIKTEKSARKLTIFQKKPSLKLGRATANTNEPASSTTPALKMKFWAKKRSQQPTE